MLAFLRWSAEAAQASPYLGMPSPYLGMPSPYLGMPSPYLGRKGTDDAMIQLDSAFQEAPWITHPKKKHVRSAGEYQPKETHRSLFEILSERHQRDVCRAQDILAFTSAVSTVLSLGGGKGRVGRPGRPGRPTLPLHSHGVGSWSAEHTQYLDNRPDV